MQTQISDRNGKHAISYAPSLEKQNWVTWETSWPVLIFKASIHHGLASFCTLYFGYPHHGRGHNRSGLTLLPCAPGPQVWEQGQSFMPFKTAVGKFLLKSHYTTANKLGLLMFGQRPTQPGCFIPKLKKKKKKIFWRFKLWEKTMSDVTKIIHDCTLYFNSCVSKWVEVCKTHHAHYAI